MSGVNHKIVKIRDKHQNVIDIHGAISVEMPKIVLPKSDVVVSASDKAVRITTEGNISLRFDPYHGRDILRMVSYQAGSSMFYISVGLPCISLGNNDEGEVIVTEAWLYDVLQFDVPRFHSLQYAEDASGAKTSVILTGTPTHALRRVFTDDNFILASEL